MKTAQKSSERLVTKVFNEVLDSKKSYSQEEVQKRYGFYFDDFKKKIKGEFTENYVYGLTPIIMLILILSGFQLVVSGIIGEYLWRTLSQARNRAKYVIDEVIEEK